MKYTTQGNCPYCDSERGIITSWGMGPVAMQELKVRHNNNHPENMPPQREVKKHKHNFVLSQHTREASGPGTNWLDFAYVTCPECGEVRKVPVETIIKKD